MGPVTIGVDVGQRVDPTAICVAEMERRPRLGSATKLDSHHVIRHLERLPLGTPYPDVADRVAKIVAGVVSRTEGELPRLYVDATGVGTPVLDILRRAGVRTRPIPVYFTYGDRRVLKEDGSVSLGKAWLVSRLQALLQTNRLHIPRTAEAAVLTKELLDYEIRIDPDANEKYGAFKVGAHDDLVTALGLATQDEATPFAVATTQVPQPPQGQGSYAAWEAWRRDFQEAQAALTEGEVVGEDVDDEEGIVIGTIAMPDHQQPRSLLQRLGGWPWQ